MPHRPIQGSEFFIESLKILGCVSLATKANHHRWWIKQADQNISQWPCLKMKKFHRELMSFNRINQLLKTTFGLTP